MPRHIAPLILFGVLASLAGCARSRQASTSESSENSAGVTFERGAVILSGRALHDGPGTLLAAMSGKVPNFRVQRHAGNQCPDITLRTHVQTGEMANPHVYVDGTRTTDTCILDVLRTDDVERVEVYPQGFTPRPGYGTHAAGLILVFMRME